MTQVGGRSKFGSRCPDATSARAMIPIVFCASFVPCVNATNAPETSWARRNPRLTRVGARRATSQVIPRIRANAEATPRNGAKSDGISTLWRIPSQLTYEAPDAEIVAPTMPPISAWLELDGSPTSQVTRFHVIAPTSPAITTSSVIASWSTIPFAIVAATATDTKAPAKFSTAALATARRGLNAPVETLVAIELAVSWKPFVKSKNSAIATTAKSITFIAGPPRARVGARYAFLTTMFAIVFAAVSQLSSARSSRS